MRIYVGGSKPLSHFVWEGMHRKEMREGKNLMNGVEERHYYHWRISIACEREWATDSCQMKKWRMLETWFDTYTKTHTHTHTYI